jgi:hypothetical protein
VSREARRVLGRWLISAWLERGVDPAHPSSLRSLESAGLASERRIERVLTRRELARLAGSPLRVRMFPGWVTQPRVAGE